MEQEHKEQEQEGLVFKQLTQEEVAEEKRREFMRSLYALFEDVADPKN